MTSVRIQEDLPGGLVARLVFSDREGTGPGGSSRAPFHWSNLGSHVGDDPESVRQNRTALADELHVAAADMVFMHPDHGRGVALVGGDDQPAVDRRGAVTGVAPGSEIQAVDAIVTCEPGVGLVALAADCVPVLLVSREPVAVAAVHSGWRGVLVDVVGAALGQLEAIGAHPGQVRAWLGPAICGRCYAVPADRVEQVREVAPQAVSTAADGQPALDLRAGIAARLARAGVAVELVGGCTAEDASTYSHRRDGRTGRQAGAVALLAASGGRA